MDKPAKVLFYVQYLLGIGHVRRAALNVRALCDLGLEVDVIFGGAPVPHISFAPARMHYLNPVKTSDLGFTGIVKIDGSEFTESEKRARIEELLNICEELQPDLIVTEMYPFGRRQMRFELKPLLKWSKQQENKPVVVSSIRDILQARRAEREEETVALIYEFYDKVLVHGDPEFTPLEVSFERTEQIKEKVAYSGYVCPPPLAPVEREPLIVVSVGGGATGRDILECALKRQQTGYAADCHWFLITGPNMPAEDKSYLQQFRSEQVSVVDLADDFVATLNKARISISMAGYNTVMDLLRTSVPSVVVPFEAVKETEQLARSTMLEERGLLTIVRESELSPETLRDAMERALTLSAQRPDFDIEGAPNTAKLIKKWAEQGAKTSFHPDNPRG